MDQKHSYHSGKWITLIGFCTAMEIILARFLSLHTWNLKIGLSFLPVAAAALIGGPLAGGRPDPEAGGDSTGQTSSVQFFSP